MSTVIEAKELTKIYGSKGITHTVLNNINFTVEKGEFLGIMGPSGAGKTTLLNLLSTIDKPTSGQIIFDNNELSKLKNKQMAKFRRNHVGFIFQDFNLLDNMSIEDNIALPLALDRVPTKTIQAKIEKLSNFFGIERQLKKYPYQLSGGEKQRTAAARALITSPSVVFADEPTGALDSKASAELLQCLSQINNKFDTTIIMVTHDAFAASYCKRILFIKDGKIYAQLNKNHERKEFYKRIMDLLAGIGGEVREYI